MIRKNVREAVRKTGEQDVYQTVECAQGKTVDETACITCQYDRGCAQVTGIAAFNEIPRKPPKTRVNTGEERGRSLPPFTGVYCDSLPFLLEFPTRATTAPSIGLR